VKTCWKFSEQDLELKKNTSFRLGQEAVMKAVKIMQRVTRQSLFSSQTASRDDRGDRLTARGMRMELK